MQRFHIGSNGAALCGLKARANPLLTVPLQRFAIEPEHQRCAACAAQLQGIFGGIFGALNGNAGKGPAKPAEVATKAKATAPAQKPAKAPETPAKAPTPTKAAPMPEPAKPVALKPAKAPQLTFQKGSGLYATIIDARGEMSLLVTDRSREALQDAANELRQKAADLIHRAERIEAAAKTWGGRK